MNTGEQLGRIHSSLRTIELAVCFGVVGYFFLKWATLAGVDPRPYARLFTFVGLGLTALYYAPYIGFAGERLGEAVGRVIRE